MRTRTRITLAGLVLGAALVGGVALATIPGDGGVYTACKFNATRTIRLIDPSLPSTSLLQHCTSLETQITWNQRGPKGDTGANGTNGTNGIDGKDGAKGDTGAQGPKGDTGAAGNNGANGAQGLQGPKGDTGATGPQGPSGSGLAPAYSAFTAGVVSTRLGVQGGNQTAWTDVVSKTLPAGQYVANFMISVENGNSALLSDNSREVWCIVAPVDSPNPTAADAAIVVVRGETDSGTLAWMKPLDLAAETTITVQCEVLAGGADYVAPGSLASQVAVLRARIVAVKVGAFS